MESRAENTIYIRARQHPILPDVLVWEAFGKARGFGFITHATDRDYVVLGAGRVLWAINKYGKKYEEYYKGGYPVERLPGMPETFDYPVIEE